MKKRGEDQPLNENKSTWSNFQSNSFLNLPYPAILPREFSLIEEARGNKKKEKSIWQIRPRFQVISPGLLADSSLFLNRPSSFPLAAAAKFS